MVEFQVPNTQAIVDHIRGLADQYPAATSKAIQRVLWEVLTESKKMCPVKTGYLRGSGYVSEPVIGYGQILASIGYSAEYAYWVHELIENYHHAPTQAKYLEIPLWMARHNIAQAVHDEVNRILGI